MESNPITSYTGFLDRIVKLISDKDKIKSFFTSNKRRIVYLILGMIIVWTSLNVWNRGECLNCTPLTPTEVSYYKENPKELIKLKDTKVFAPHTSWGAYLRDLVLPLTFNLIGFVLTFSVCYIVYHTIRLLLVRFKVNPNTSINLDKFLKKND